MRSQPLRFLHVLLLACLVAVPAVASASAADPPAVGPPDWAFDTAGWSDFMAVTGRLDLDGDAAITPGTLVGAFVDGALRGSAEVDLRFLDTLGPLFFLQVWSNGAPGEIVTFRAYDPVSDAVLLVGETLAYDGNATPGTPTAPFVWSAESVGTPPPWDFDPGAFEFFMGITGTVLIGGESIAPVSGHRVAAFVGDELRGVVEVNLNAVDPFGPLFFLQIWAGQSSGETIRFEVWDAVGDVVYETAETVPFMHQTTLGTVPDPFAWTATGGPFAFDDVATTYEDEPTTIYVLANDPGGEALTVTSVSAPANGTATVGMDGGVTYTPAPEFSGTDSFIYTATDSGGSTTTATVTVTVVAVNDAPLFESDPVTDAEVGSVYSYAVAASDVDDEALTITAPELPAWLTLTDGGDGTAALTGKPPMTGSYTVTLAVSDGDRGAEQGFAITVVGENGVPSPGNDTAETDEDMAVVIDVLANDSDPDGDALSVLAVQGVTMEGGSAELDGASSAVFYTPQANFFGIDSFTYTVSDDDGATATATVTVTVTSVNDAPTFVSEPVTTAEAGSPYTYSVGASDVDDGVLAITAPELPAWLVLTDDGDGSASLAGTPSEAGTYAVTLVVSDGDLEADQAFTITVTATNSVPTAADDAAETDEDAAVSIAVLVNDSDPDGDALAITAVSSPPNGVATIGADGEVTYSPSLDFFGMDAFTYTVADGNGGTATATVTITVNPINDAPEFESEPVTSAETGSPYAYAVEASDVDDGVLAITAEALPPWLVLTDGGDGMATLAGTPPAAGTYAVTLVVSDGALQAEQSFTITVTGTNSAPVASDDAVETDEDAAVVIDVLANDTDPDGDTLTVLAVSVPANGTAEADEDNEITYTPTPDFFGADAFTYTVSDGNGGTATATVTVTVSPVNDAPTPAVITAPEDGTSIVLTGNPEATIVVIWDPSTDIEGDALTYRWEAALDGDFTTLLLTAATEGTSVATTFDDLDGALDAAGVGAGETVLVMHRVVTSDGVAETQGLPLTINVTRGVLVDAEGAVPLAFSASAAYPNPSAGPTAITLDLPSATDVVIEVYDSAGRRVLSRSEALSAGASRRVKLGSPRLSAGLYHYRVMTGPDPSSYGEKTVVRGRFTVVR